MKYSLSIALFCLLSLGCRREDFLKEYTPPPPDPRFTKVYQFNLTSSEVKAVNVDILWVIDNSYSMDPYHSAVIQNSAKFIQQFTSTSALFWRMGLISTTQEDAPYMGFDPIVDWQTYDAVSVFNTAVARLGVFGSGTEMTFDPVLSALRAYPKFLRPGAFLVLIVVSDEEEQSSIDTSAFVSAIVRKIGGDPGHFVAFGVFGPDSNTSANQKYNELIAQTNGKSYDLKSPDYGTLLAELGQDLVRRTTEVVPIVMLDQRPNIATIQVMYAGAVLRPGPPELGGQWTYDPNFNLIRIHDMRAINLNDLNVTISFELAQPRP